VDNVVAVDNPPVVDLRWAALSVAVGKLITGGRRPPFRQVNGHFGPTRTVQHCEVGIN
jgi:hypothetical protein